MWTFPEGRGAPASAAYGHIARLEILCERQRRRGNGKRKGADDAGEGAYAVHAFSWDSLYVAESLPGGGIHNSQIRVVELANGKQVSAFGKHGAFSIAVSPDGVTRPQATGMSSSCGICLPESS